MSAPKSYQAPSPGCFAATLSHPHPLADAEAKRGKLAKASLQGRGYAPATGTPGLPLPLRERAGVRGPLRTTQTLVRPASVGDVARFVELGLRFYDEEGGREASPRELARFAYSHLGDENRAFLAAGEPAAGFLCGVLAPHYFTGEPTAFKTAWYALPGSRGLGAHLLKAFEAWARAKGARRIVAAGRQERTLTLLGRLGYVPIETVTSKDLP